MPGSPTGDIAYLLSVYTIIYTSGKFLPSVDAAELSEGNYEQFLGD